MDPISEALFRYKNGEFNLLRQASRTYGVPIATLSRRRTGKDIRAITT